MNRRYPNFYTIREVAGMLCVSEDTIYRLAKAGKLGGGKVGKQWRFSQTGINKMLDERRSSTQ